ncbi:putative transposon transposition protein [Cupriavidus taiwanensis]|uniref:TnsD family Tn7-like transposition protein n=1 Tax=Cupriavidus taiwanensis TaxID=164546 RepID=UPI000E1880B0|nr:TnsD family Tn7-like transposition protein [Cupriavidus taiwanensis]SOY93242.1 putative transposon transposition protein [Cupriavidus taiwanensis]SOY96511.1 putative transposon transposition protein [Cupriavidus taiwanensis]
MNVFIHQPYPDELLYSICMRYFCDFDSVAYGVLVNELFGKPHKIIPPYLSTAIEVFAKRTQFSTGLCAGEIYRLHTMYPFICSAMPAAKKMEVYEAALGEHLGKSIPGLVRHVVSPPLFRWCPDCVDSDRENLHETYWHRMHQLPGVWQCPIHGVDLVDSKIDRYCLDNSGRFPAELIVPVDTTPFRVTSPATEAERILRERLFALLNGAQPNMTTGYCNFHEATLMAGYGRVGKIDYKRVFSEFSEFWGDVLDRLDGHKHHRAIGVEWVHSYIAAKTPPWNPLVRELLRLFFLSVHHIDSDHVCGPEIRKQAQRLQYICPNPYADHGRGTVVERVERSKVDESLVYLRCSCGFSVHVPRAMANKDIPMESVVQVGRYGDAWPRQAKALKSKGLKKTEIAKQMGVGWPTVKYWLRPDTLGPRISHEELMRFRKKWKKLLSTVAPLSSTHASRLEPRLFKCLVREDPVWLRKVCEAHRLKFRKCNSTAGRYIVDWAARDAEYNAAVEAAAFRLGLVGSASAFSEKALMQEAGIPVGKKSFYAERIPATMATIARLTKSNPKEPPVQ